MTRLAAIFFVGGDDGLAIFFSRDFPIMVIACLDLPFVIVYAASVATTFTRATAATVSPTVYPTVASTGLNTGNVLGRLVLWYLGYSGFEVVIRLQICNNIKVIPAFKSLDCVLDLRVLYLPE